MDLSIHRLMDGEVLHMEGKMHNLSDVITELRKFIKYSNEHCSEVQNLNFENSLYELSLQYYMAALCEESQRALSLSQI